MANLRNLIKDVLGGLKREGSFSQNYALVLSGTGLTILVQFFVTPILTRLYGPEAYGTFSVFNAVSTNLALVAGLRFSQAMLLPKEEIEFQALVRISLVCITLFSGILFFVLIINPVAILSIFNAEKLAPYSFVIPISVFLLASNQIMGQWQYRLNVFKKSVGIDTSILIGVRLFNLAYGWASKGMVLGLVMGDMIGKIAGLLLSGLFIIKSRIKDLAVPLSFKFLKQTVVKYKQYPLYNLPGVWFITLSDQLPIFFVVSSFGLSSVGYLSLATSMMDLPKRLFAYSVSSVFYKKANDLHHVSHQELTSFVLKIIYLLAAVAILPYAIIIVFGEEIFAFAFGNEWLLSGQVARYLACYYVFELLYISVDSVFYVLRQERKMFFFQAATLVTRLLGMSTAIYIGLPVEYCIASLAAINVVLYTSQLAYVMHLLKINWTKHLPILVGLMLSGVAILFAFRFMIGKFFN